MRTALKYIATGIIAAVVSTTTFADDSLKITNSSVNGFSGTFQADAHTIVFDSTLESDTLVNFTVNIDGEEREASFDLKESQLTLTDGKQQLTPAEQDLMYDTAQAVAAYVLKSQDDLGEHLVVLVGAMDYWSALSSIR
ncbi:hypothetical protein [Alkalimarinus sediminis]|uniref:Uncharacterized protein n=1 Tax=Alkalimarinus sediminis TaxID=1632866 RepID=A0A9E8KPJ4_9ALTE|nr:hypothetical protein [Alkalimarinus sediminis]UZW73567.1 hypothetical protein NNL22_11000 [Alkalimarinus sediminis]